MQPDLRKLTLRTASASCAIQSQVASAPSYAVQTQTVIFSTCAIHPMESWTPCMKQGPVHTHRAVPTSEADTDNHRLHDRTYVTSVEECHETHSKRTTTTANDKAENKCDCPS